MRVFIEKNIRLKYQKRIKYENKFLENKERLMIITKVDLQDIKSDLVNFKVYFKRVNKNFFFQKEDFEKEIGFSKLIWFLSQSVNNLIK